MLPSLLQWIQYHFPQGETKTRKILQEEPERPEAHPDYWDALSIFISQGKKTEAQNLLRLHSGYVDQQPTNSSSASAFSLSSLDELVRKMPLFNSQMSVVDFNFRWKHWQDEVVVRYVEI